MGEAPERPPPHQTAQFDQAHAEINATIDELITSYRHVRIQNAATREVDIAGLATFLLESPNSREHFAEALTVAVVRLAEQRAEIERQVRQQAIRDLDAGEITADELAAAGIETEHIIDLRYDGWTIRHPLSCGPHLFDCTVNRAAERWASRRTGPGRLGQYVCSLDDDGRFVVGDQIARGGPDAQ